MRRCRKDVARPVTGPLVQIVASRCRSTLFGLTSILPSDLTSPHDLWAWARCEATELANRGVGIGCARATVPTKRAFGLASGALRVIEYDGPRTSMTQFGLYSAMS